jgi:HD-GYP domain-containing protein (c-di-GMP phosphodiesterase class II)
MSVAETNPSENSPDAGASQDADAGSLVSTEIQNLITGRVLHFPIFDESGLLLLAEGMTLTSEFLRAIKGRNVNSVQLHKEDYSRLTFQEKFDPAEENRQLDENLVKKLDEVVDTGLLSVVNSEPAVADQLSIHGCKNYNRQNYIDRVNRQKDTSVFVDNMLRNAMRGRSVDCGEVMHLTMSYLNDITSDIDSTISSQLDAIRQDPISDHCVAMSVLGMAIGVEMGLDGKNVRTIALAGLLHDWGMLCVPKHIREAPRKLTDDEYFEIKKHPIYTLRLLDRMCGVPIQVPLICYQVHERPNGSGYPHSRRGERIHLMAKILAVADAYNALISSRPHRPPLIPYAAMECILRQTAVGNFDPKVSRALLMLQSLFPIGSYVILDDGSIARVLRRNKDKFTQPIVRVVQDSDGKSVPDDAEGSVMDLAEANLGIVKALPAPGSNAVGLNHDILSLERLVDEAGGINI